MPYITKVFQFCASHQYFNPEWSPKKNKNIFGDDCRQHGHNYSLEITVTGKINPETGFIFDLRELKSIVNKHIINVIDHSSIEADIPWFKGKQPSSENMVIWMWDILKPKIKRAKLYRIRLQETPTIYTDYFGAVEK